MKVSLLVVLISVGFMTGCGSRETVELASNGYPRRIVCATPGLAEVVFALGAGDRVVGVSDYTVWPPEALDVTRIGGWMNPDRERLLLLQPDLILTQGLHEPLQHFARRYGVRFEQIPTDTLDDVVQQFAVVGAIIGAAEEGARLQEALQAQLAEIRAKVSVLTPRRTVLLLERPEGVLRNLTTVGPRTFLHSLLELAGGENVFQDVVGDYPQISRESLMMRAPEVIMELHDGALGEARRAAIMQDWQTMSSLPAVQDGNIVFLTGDHVLIPGPRIIDTIRHMAQLLHPESF